MRQLLEKGCWENMKRGKVNDVTVGCERTTEGVFGEIKGYREAEVADKAVKVMMTPFLIINFQKLTITQ